MLNKLLKYDLKAIYKPLSIFYIIIITCAFLARLFSVFNQNHFTLILCKFFEGTTTGFFVGAIINNGLNIWAYFRQDFYGDRSYLTHTLPIPEYRLLLSKFLTILITTLTTIIIGVASLLFAHANPEFFEFAHQFLNSNGIVPTIFKYILPLLILIYLEFIFVIQCGIIGIVIGHRFNNRKILLSLITGFTIYIIANIFIVTSMLLASIFNQDINSIFTNNELRPETLTIFLYGGIIIYGIYNIAIYAGSLKLLQQGIDVE